MLTGIKKQAYRFWRNDAGVVAIIVALSLPMFIGAAGVAVDLAQAYNMKNRLASAIDKASLAGGSTLGSIDEIEDRVTRFFNVNYPPEKLGAPYNLSVVVGEDSTVTVSAYASVDTTFMELFGKDSISVYAETIVKRELAGVEAVLVLDVTGSMAGSRISDLKIAAASFIDIMFDRIEDDEYIKIGIVPYSSSVNVGSYGLGIDEEGDAYDAPFVDNPAVDDYVNPASNIQFGVASDDWHGCILERSSPDDTNDNAAPNWGMYRYPKSCSWWWNGSCQSWTTPNRYCTTSPIVPLTNSQAKLLTSINGLNANGYTYGNVGMVWGYHVMTPDTPFVEGVDMADDTWSRTIVMMTDGDNYTYNPYSAYGSYPGISVNDLNTKLSTVCTNAKADGITIYTITFDSGVSESTKDIYRNCASDAAKYFDTDDGSDLAAAFEEIANQLSQLHIVQ